MLETISMSRKRDLEIWRAKRCREKGRQPDNIAIRITSGTLDCVEEQGRPETHFSHNPYLTEHSSLSPPVSQPEPSRGGLPCRARQPCGSCARSRFHTRSLLGARAHARAGHVLAVARNDGGRTRS
jgi:hypothetical protein